MRYRPGILLVLVAVVAAGCAGDDTATGGAGEPTEPAVAAQTPDAATEPPGGDGTTAGTTIAVSSTELGEILTDGEDNTLYLFLNDEQGESTCYDDCEDNWPPLTGAVDAGEGVDESLMGTVQRDDGTSQVTYNDWPLYYFAGDSAPGDTAGQGVGDVWFVVDAAGEPVRDAAVSKAGGY